MNVVIELEKELLRYESMLNRIKRRKKYYLKGSLIINKRKHGCEYYHQYKNEFDSIERKYIRKNKNKIIKNLASKSYYNKIEPILKKRVEEIKRLINNYNQFNIEDDFLNIEKERRVFISPIENSFDDIVKKWKSKKFTPNQYQFNTQSLITKNGERVRSKSEKILADLFYDNNIIYKYECPLYLDEKYPIYPDFTILSPYTYKEIYWEHFGLMDNPGYAIKAIKKIELYAKYKIMYGENLLFTFE